MDWLGGHLEATHGVHVTGLSRPQAWNPSVLRVDRGDEPPWIARVFNENRPVERAEGDASVLRCLADAGFPAERCATEAAVSVHAGHAVLVTEFVAGRAASDAATDLEAIGERLGRLHSLDGIPPACSREGGAWHGDPAFEGAPRQDVAHASERLRRSESRVPLHLSSRFDDLRRRLDSAEDCSSLPQALLHPDPAPVNAVVSPDDGMVLIDWTGAGVGPRIASLALVLLTGPAPVAGGYRRHVSLDADELDRLADAIRIRALFWTAFYLHMALTTGGPVSGNEGWWPNEDAIDAAADTARDILG